MTNEEIKMEFAKSGVAEADIEKISEKYDAEKITELVEAANTPEEAFVAIHAFYPELEVEALQKQCDFVKEQVEAAMNEQKQKQCDFVMEQVEAAMKDHKQNELVELTEDELENVAGGGLFDSIGGWFKDNWKKVAVGAAIAVGVALVCTGFGSLVGFALAADAALFHAGVAVGSYMATGAAYGAIAGAVVGTATSTAAGLAGRY